MQWSARHTDRLILAKAVNGSADAFLCLSPDGRNKRRGAC